MSSVRGLYSTVVSLRCDSALLIAYIACIYLSLSSTTIVEPLSALSLYITIIL